MPEYKLITNTYALPTPAGTYFAASHNIQDPCKQLLLSLLTQEKTQLLTIDRLCEWTGIADEQDALKILYRLQSLNWIQGNVRQRSGPAGNLAETLPTLLESFSLSERSLLADNEGFYLAYHGFSHESAEELSALSADIASLHERHTGLLHHNLRINSSSWALVDAAGNSQLGIWPLYIGKLRFVLVVSGLPHFNQPIFTEIVWALTKRYGLPDNQQSPEEDQLFDDGTSPGDTIIKEIST